MRKSILLGVVLVCTMALLGGPLLAAKGYKVEFTSEAIINGVQVEKGRYELVINGNSEVELYDGKELIVKAKAVIEPLGKAIPNSVNMDRDGNVREIRLKKDRVVFAKS